MTATPTEGVTQADRDELSALGYSVVDAHNDIVESGWLMRPPCITDRAWIAATEDEAWLLAYNHRHPAAAEVERLREALQRIASCESRHPGDVVSIARAALAGES